MKIKHSQIRALVKFAGIVVFSFSLYQKLKQIFIYGGTLANLPTEAIDEVSPMAMVEASESLSKYMDTPSAQIVSYDDSDGCDECCEECENSEFEQEQGG